MKFAVYLKEGSPAEEKAESLFGYNHKKNRDKLIEELMAEPDPLGRDNDIRRKPLQTFITEMYSDASEIAQLFLDDATEAYVTSAFIAADALYHNRANGFAKDVIIYQSAVEASDINVAIHPDIVDRDAFQLINVEFL